MRRLMIALTTAATLTILPAHGASAASFGSNPTFGATATPIRCVSDSNARTLASYPTHRFSQARLDNLQRKIVSQAGRLWFKKGIYILKVFPTGYGSGLCVLYSLHSKKQDTPGLLNIISQGHPEMVRIAKSSPKLKGKIHFG